MVVTQIFYFLKQCTDFDWDRVNFLYSSLHSAIFGICDQNCVDKALLSTAYVASRPFLFLILPLQCLGWGGQRVGRGHSQESLSKLMKEVFNVIRCCTE